MSNQAATEVRQEWADTIRVERHRRRLKQVEVADLAGLTQPVVSDAENGKGSLDSFLAIGKALGLDLVGQS